MKRVMISNSSLNSYGSRVMTAGMDVSQYMRNPVLLYMHERGNVIGCVKDLKVDGDEVTGELMFDEASELSKRCKKQYEFGSLKMVSVGIDVVETSKDASVLLEGQTCESVTRSKLYEVSLVDVGANDDALVMTRDGVTMKLMKTNINQRDKRMEMKSIALQLGLPETATDAEITARLGVLNAAQGEVTKLEKEKDTMLLCAITQEVEHAIAEKRIGADRKDQFVKLGKAVGLDELKQTFDAMTPQVKLSKVIVGAGGGAGGGGGVASYKKLSDVPDEELEVLRAEHADIYKKLYKAEYGMDCDVSSDMK